MKYIRRSQFNPFREGEFVFVWSKISLLQISLAIPLPLFGVRRFGRLILQEHGATSIDIGIIQDAYVSTYIRGARFGSRESALLQIRFSIETSVG